MKFKSIQLLFLCVMVFLLSSSLVAQLNTDISGIYSFKKESYQENIELRNDGMFFYNVSMEFINLKVSGYWNIQHDSILLSSKPFYERMLVWESRKKKKVYEVFVTDKKRAFISYTIKAILQNGDTLLLSNQWRSTKFDIPIKSFIIVDNKGLTSPEYLVQGSKTNFFEVLFETNRVFENEKWKYEVGKLIPKGFNGLEQNFKLSRL